MPVLTEIFIKFARNIFYFTDLGKYIKYEYIRFK